MIHIKPRAGLRVPDPDTGQALPAEGRRVPDNSYWRRRISDGDVELTRTAKAVRPRRKQETTEEGE